MTRRTSSLRPNARQRREALLAAIRDLGGEWTTVRVLHLYRSQGVCCRSTARADLKQLTQHGVLIQHDHADHRFFTLNYARRSR